MHATSDTPESGESFAVPDLMIAQAWAEYHGLRFVVELDRLVDGRAYEEVLCFSLAHFRHWTVWRSGEEIVALPDAGSLSRFPTLSEALEGLGLEELILSA